MSKMRTKVSYSSCTFYVEGMDMECPLCKVLVMSGKSHECSKPDAVTVAKVDATKEGK